MNPDTKKLKNRHYYAALEKLDPEDRKLVMDQAKTLERNLRAKKKILTTSTKTGLGKSGSLELLAKLGIFLTEKSIVE